MERSRLLTRLWEFQNNNGFISDKAILEISQELRVSKIEIEGVVSFYHFFHRQPTYQRQNLLAEVGHSSQLLRNGNIVRKIQVN